MSHKRYQSAFFVFLFIITGFNPLLDHSSSAQAAEAGETGIVMETMNTSGYTYMNVDTGEEKVWVAIPEADVKTGDKVTYQPGMVMSNFQSKSLNKTFAAIIFSPGLQGQENINPHGSTIPQPAGPSDSFASAVQAEQGATMKPQPEQVSGGSAGAIAPLAEVDIEKAAGENGFTVEEIFAQKDALNGKTVRIRGKVVKYNPNIMGKNWIHIQDGTGNPMKNTHDLVITTTDTLTSEGIIIIEGKMTANKDFGAGYKYAAIVEEAKLIK